MTLRTHASTPAPQTTPPAPTPRLEPLPGPRVTHTGTWHRWGPIVSVTDLGRFTILEYLRDNSAMIPAEHGAPTHGRPAFSVYVDDRPLLTGHDTVEDALVSAVEFVAAGPNSQLAALFHRATTGTLPGERRRKAKFDDAVITASTFQARIGAFTFRTHDGQWLVRTSNGAIAPRPTLERAILAAVALERGVPDAGDVFERAAFGVTPADGIVDGVAVSALAQDAARWNKAERVIADPRTDDPIGKQVDVHVSGSPLIGGVLRGELVHIESPVTPSGTVHPSRFGRVHLDEPLWGRQTITVEMRHISARR